MASSSQSQIRICVLCVLILDIEIKTYRWILEKMDGKSLWFFFRWFSKAKVVFLNNRKLFLTQYRLLPLPKIVNNFLLLLPTNHSNKPNKQQQQSCNHHVPPPSTRMRSLTVHIHTLFVPFPITPGRCHRNFHPFQQTCHYRFRNCVHTRDGGPI